MTRQPTVADVVAAVHRRYDPARAESWDAVGLVCGDPDAPVRRIHFAVDACDAVVEEALAAGADLLITHHPLLLTPVTSVAATTPAGRILHRLIAGGCALLAAHTNADVAADGVSDALAEALGVLDVAPLVPLDETSLDTLVTFVPPSDLEPLLAALAAAGAGRLGDYDSCSAVVEPVTGRFRPLDGANPTIGVVGELTTVVEARVEVSFARSDRDAVLRALRAAHPYEQPAFHLLEQAPSPGRTGLGRVGSLAEPTTLRAFAERVAAALPATAHGVRVAGDLDQPVRRVAVCGGSGSDVLPVAAAVGADVVVTADLKHHVTQDHLSAGGCAVVDVAHWASEWPWLPRARSLLVADLAAVGATVDTHVSVLVTDPWTARL